MLAAARELRATGSRTIQLSLAYRLQYYRLEGGVERVSESLSPGVAIPADLDVSRYLYMDQLLQL